MNTDPMKTTALVKCNPSPAITAGKFVVKLRSVGNPDYGQYAPISNPELAIVDTLQDAARECCRYVSEWNLGGGNWPTTIVTRDGKPVAKVSYNGRLWAMDGKEMGTGCWTADNVRELRQEPAQN